MFKTIIFALGAVLIVAMGFAQAAGPVGLDALTHMERAGEMRPGVRSYMASSHDLDGGNGDNNTYLAQEGDEYVLLDVKGPGCILRIWMTVRNWNDDGMFRIYFDGESSPRVEMVTRDFFSGQNAPFLTPLVGDHRVSSGGYYCYVPMMFSNGCKVTMTTDASLNYYNIQYQLFDSAEGITTFSGSESVDAARTLWQQAGSCPHDTAGSQDNSLNDITLEPGAAAVLATNTGAGTIQKIELNIDGMGEVQHRHVTDDGRSFDGHSEFRVAVDPNNQGVKLTRRLNYRTPDQKANVYVDGVLAGQWFNGDNREGTWRDSDFWLPANLTAGKSSLLIRVEFVSAAYDFWNEFYYWVHSRVGWQTILTDEIDVGDPASESAHDYSVTHNSTTYPQILETRSAHYVNPLSPARYYDDGRAFKDPNGYSEFTMAIDPANSGVKLVRRFDNRIANQKADIYVRDAGGTLQLVGQWYTPVSGSGWQDIAITLPGSYTSGRSAVTVRIDFVSSNNDINEFHYWAYSLVGGQEVLTDTLDVGRPDSESFHNYSISGQSWSGGGEWQYTPTQFDAYKNQLASLWLRFYWDGEAAPAVDVPIGPFFGSGLGPAPVTAVPLGIDGDRLYCYWPMPFGSEMRVELYNSGSTTYCGMHSSVTWKTLPEKPGPEVGRFHVQYIPMTATVPDQDFIMLDETGPGQLMGIVQTMREYRDSNWFLEGDERIYVDGAATPTLYGTGTEDFYNAGWYFANDIFCRPVHGHPFYLDESNNSATCYRFMVSDYVPFTRSIVVGIEHGGSNDEAVSMETVAYYYKFHRPAARVMDRLDVGQSSSESGHNYTMVNGSSVVYASSPYEGDYDTVNLVDNGREIAVGGSSSFTLSVWPPNNNGLLLRRRMDYRVVRQKAEVFVDNQSAGIWYDAGRNTDLYFRDSEFMIPPALTQGKTEIEVRIENRSDESVWTEYYYWLETQLPPIASVAADFDYDGDVDQEDFAHIQACLTGPGVTQNSLLCKDADLQPDIPDNDVDNSDMTRFRGCLSGTKIAPALDCLD